MSNLLCSRPLSPSIAGETKQLKLVGAINNALDIAMETDSTAGIHVYTCTLYIMCMYIHVHVHVHVYTHVRTCTLYIVYTHVIHLLWYMYMYMYVYIVYLCYVHMICNTPTPGHPSAADDAWYWQKCILRIG